MQCWRTSLQGCPQTWTWPMARCQPLWSSCSSLWDCSLGPKTSPTTGTGQTTSNLLKVFTCRCIALCMPSSASAVPLKACLHTAIDFVLLLLSFCCLLEVCRKGDCSASQPILRAHMPLYCCLRMSLSFCTKFALLHSVRIC